MRFNRHQRCSTDLGQILVRTSGQSGRDIFWLIIAFTIHTTAGATAAIIHFCADGQYRKPKSIEWPTTTPASPPVIDVFCAEHHSTFSPNNRKTVADTDHLQNLQKILISHVFSRKT